MFSAAANSVQQRRAGNEIGGNGMNRGSGVHQGNIPSGSIAHPGSMQQPGSVSADGPHSIAQGITPLAASLNQHHRITSAQVSFSEPVKFVRKDLLESHCFSTVHSTWAYLMNLSVVCWDSGKRDAW